MLSPFRLRVYGCCDVAKKVETHWLVIAYHTHTTMAMSKEQHEQLISAALELESSGPIAPAPPGRAPPPPPPTVEMQRQLLFAKIFTLAKTVITKEKLVALTTKNGNTQASERTSIPLIRDVLDQLRLSYTEAGSQQSKDFRNVGGIGLNIEVKKTDGNMIKFNDTCPNEDIWYLILFTGVENTRRSIPPGVLGLNGAEFMDDSEWVSDYQREIDAIKDKYCRGEGKKALSGKMSVYARPTYTGDISEFLEELKE